MAINFLRDVRNGSFYSMRVARNHLQAEHDLKRMASQLIHVTDDVKPVTYPSAHMMYLMEHLADVIYGSFVFIGALSRGQFRAADKVGRGVLLLTCTAMIDLLNSALATVSLAGSWIGSRDLKVDHEPTSILRFLS